MSSTDPELRKRIETAEKRQHRTDSAFVFLHDPIEDEEPMAQLIKQAQSRAEVELDLEIQMGRLPNIRMGNCHGVWKKMKRILKDEQGITWYSPAEMNPKIHFD